MKAAPVAAALLAALGFGGTVAAQGCSARVDPMRYDQVFVWAGTSPVVMPDRISLAYVLGGEIARSGPPRLVLRNAGPHVRDVALWLVVRTPRLDWTAATRAAVLAELVRWRAAGNRVVGLQVDFDAATAAIDRYVAFLAALRRDLPRPWQLSATGLLDWSAHGDPAQLARLNGIVDELVIQTYRGRHSEPGYADYFRAIARIPVRHKIAVVAGGTWCAPPALADDRGFAGMVVFLPPRGRNTG